MSEELTTIDLEAQRKAWLQRLADEFIKLAEEVPLQNPLPETGGPPWVANLEREITATMFPVAKTKDHLELTPKRMGAIIGHQCANAVWMRDEAVAQILRAQADQTLAVSGRRPVDHRDDYGLVRCVEAAGQAGALLMCGSNV